MKSYFKNYPDKKIEYLLLGLSIVFFSTPILIYGNTDYETYYWGYFSNKIYNETYFNPFKNFIDYYGPGTEIPLGFFPYYHPLSSIFVNNYKFFIFFSLILNLFIQYVYLKKILKFFNIKKYYLLLPPLVVFSISNYNYVWSSDWIQVFYTYTFFFPCFYYFLRLSKKSDLNLFIKLSFVLGFSIINSHPGVFINLLMFLILFSFFNNYFFHLKNKFFYVFLILFILISVELIFFQVTEYFKYKENYPDLKKVVQDSFSWKHYLASIFLPINFSDWTGINRYPFYGIIFFFSFYKAFKITIQKNSKKYFFLNYLFFLFIILSLSELTKKIVFISAIWQLRDITNIITLILFFVFLNELPNKKFKKTIFYFCYFFIFTFYVGNFIKYMPFQKSKNFFDNKEISEEFKNFTKKLSANKIDNRVYLSPEFYKDLNSFNLKNYGLFSSTDLIELKFAPFNGSFKGVYLGDFNKPFTKTRSYIKPSFDYINNDFFLNIFSIKFVLIYEDEIESINMNDFKINNEIDIINNNNKEQKKKKLFLLEKNNYNKKIQIKTNLGQFNSCKYELIIDCIKKNQRYFKFINKVDLKSESQNYRYTFSNSSNEDLFILTPFLYSKNWKSKIQTSIKSIDSKLMFLEIKKNTEVVIFYKNKIRESLKIISFLTLLFVLIYLVLSKFKFIRNKV